MRISLAAAACAASLLAAGPAWCHDESEVFAQENELEFVAGLIRGGEYALSKPEACDHADDRAACEAGAKDLVARLNAMDDRMGKRPDMNEAVADPAAFAARKAIRYDAVHLWSECHTFQKKFSIGGD